MSWVRLDDRWDMNSKLERAAELPGVGDSAWTMWSRADTQCNRELTNGRIAGATLRARTRNKKPQAVIEALVRFRAIHDEHGRASCYRCSETHPQPLENDEYLIHDYLDWNPTRESVESLREQKRESASKGGKASAHARKGPSNEALRSTKVQAPCLPSASPESYHAGLKSSPLLSSPSGSSNTEHKTPPKAGDAVRGNRCPDPFDDSAQEWLSRAKVPQLNDERFGAEVESFMNYWCGVPGAKGIKLNWQATWRNHINDDRHQRKTGPAARFAEPVEVGSVPEANAPVAKDPRIQRIIEEQRAERVAAGLPGTPDVPANATHALLALLGGRP